VTDWVGIENQAGLARVTCGWKRPELPWETVRRYWRDVHSPSIARRDGIWEYRHHQFDPVRADLFGQVAGVETTCPDDARLMWLSDVRYADAAALAAFGASPSPEVRGCILGDIDMIVERSTTYLVVGQNAHTFRDLGDGPPQGIPPSPAFAVFFRQRGAEEPFRAAARELAERWARTAGVIRVRLNLFEVPDMEAERKAGYPVKTHPQAQQYQAWIDLTIETEAVAAGLFPAGQGHASEIATVHAYPQLAIHTFNVAGLPTLAGLRGYPAHEAIQAMGAVHQARPPLLSWMYGAVVREGPAA
jgi:hypothetical protein